MHHIHEGQRYVLGFHDHSSSLDKVYPIKRRKVFSSLWRGAGRLGSTFDITTSIPRVSSVEGLGPHPFIPRATDLAEVWNDRERRFDARHIVRINHTLLSTAIRAHILL